MGLEETKAGTVTRPVCTLMGTPCVDLGPHALAGANYNGETLGWQLYVATVHLFLFHAGQARFVDDAPPLGGVFWQTLTSPSTNWPTLDSQAEGTR